MRLTSNNKIPFFPYIFIKDFFGFILIACLYLLQTLFGIYSFSHPDNALEACGLGTPLHIVPEWYFLCQYAMLKAVPNKNAGFIILLTSIFMFFFFGEIRNLTTFLRLIDDMNVLWKFIFFLSFILFCWIGAQFPQEKFLSYYNRHAVSTLIGGEILLLWSFVFINVYYRWLNRNNSWKCSSRSRITWYILCCGSFSFCTFFGSCNWYLLCHNI